MASKGRNRFSGTGSSRRCSIISWPSTIPRSGIRGWPGGGRYIHIWKWVADRFLLDESISIDHAAALEYPHADIDDE